MHMHATGHVVNVGKKNSSELDCNSEDFVQLGVLLLSQSQHKLALSKIERKVGDPVALSSMEYTSISVCV